jgi:hypothetical protein|tara:strand:+ start:972 stop:1247 length:276 start_codon:yes stop_codon:yes gene_type:complete
MGKISQKDTDALVNSGVLSKRALTEMENKNLVAKNKSSIRRFMKTADGKFVEPSLYFRGAKGTKPSKKMTEFTTEYQKLLEKYTTTKTNNK